MPEALRFTFGPSQRLTHATQFERVYDYRLRKVRGSLSLSAKPNDLPHTRLGLAISKSVGAKKSTTKKKGSTTKAGTAVIRNRLKRLLREAFRLQQHELPSGYDLVISARPHALLELAEYQRLLSDLVQDVVAEVDRRERRAKRDEGAGKNGKDA